MIAFLQTSLYGLAGVSMKLTGLLMIGIGLSGVIMNVLRLILLATITSY